MPETMRSNWRLHRRKFHHILTSVKIRLRNQSNNLLFCIGQLTERYPFDWKNPIGYAIAVIIQCLVTFYLLHYLTCFLSIPLGAYLIANSVNEFMEIDLKSINKMAKRENTKSAIFKPFSRFIRSNAEFKQLSC